MTNPVAFEYAPYESLVNPQVKCVDQPVYTHHVRTLPAEQ